MHRQLKVSPPCQGDNTQMLHPWRSQYNLDAIPQVRASSLLTVVCCLFNSEEVTGESDVSLLRSLFVYFQILDPVSTPYEEMFQFRGYCGTTILNNDLEVEE